MSRSNRRERQQRFEAEVLRTVRDASKDVVEEGLARLEEEESVGGPFLRLQPLNPRAASLTVYPDYPTLEMGPEQYATEMFGPEDVRLAELRQLVRAVIAGRYEWEHRQVESRFLFLRLRPFTQLVGTFHTESGPWVFTREGGEPPGARERRTYEPYRA